MSSASPGPWSVSPTDDTVVIDATRGEVAAIDGDYNDPDTWPQMEANARLIAAAPDLLSIVKQFIALPSGAWHPERHAAEEAALMQAARAAIAKAEGRSDA